MSNVVYLRQDQQNVKEINMEMLKKMVIKEHLYFGVMNEIFVYENYAGNDSDIREKYFVLFDRSLYGRGFELYVGDDYHVELILHAFSTKIDIAAYYTFIRDLCRELGLDEFEQEGERCFLDQLDDLYREAALYHRKLIKEQLKPNITVFGCIYPIEIDEKLTDGIRLLKEEAAHDLYERYLDERQKQDLYYAKPVLFKGPPIHARYAIVEGVPSILPNKAKLPAVYQLHFKEAIKEWSILLLKKKEQDYSPEAEIDYDDFLHMIRAAKCPRFDASHLIVTYDDSLDEKVQQWKIRKGRERLILWLRKEHGPVADPPKIAFVKEIRNEAGETCALYKFKKSWLSKWLLGIVTENDCFSAFEEYHAENDIQDAEKLWMRLKTIWKQTTEKTKH